MRNLKLCTAMALSFLSGGFALAESKASTEGEGVAVSGRLIGLDNEGLHLFLDKSNFRWQLSRCVRDYYLPVDNGRIEIAQDGSYAVKLWHRKYLVLSQEKADALYFSDAVLQVYAKGYLGQAVFKLNGIHGNVEGVNLQFREKFQNHVQLRVMDVETGRPATGKTMNICILSGQRNTFTLESGVTNEKGMVGFEELPEGVVGIAEEGYLTGLSLLDHESPVYDTMLAYVPSVETSRQRNDPVIVHYLRSELGILWRTIGEKPLSPGTILQFSAHDGRSPEWNPDLRFEVTVGADGMVKTPAVPRGEYKVRSLKGDPYDGDVSIQNLYR